MLKYLFSFLMIALLSQAAFASSDQENCARHLRAEQRGQLMAVLLNTEAGGIFLSIEEMKILVGDVQNQIKRHDAIFGHLLFLYFHYEQAIASNNSFIFLDRKNLDYLRSLLRHPLPSRQNVIPKSNAASIMARAEAPKKIRDLLKEMEARGLGKDSDFEKLKRYIYYWQGSLSREDYNFSSSLEIARYFRMTDINASETVILAKIENHDVRFYKDSFPWFHVRFKSQFRNIKYNQGYRPKVYINVPLKNFPNILPKLLNMAKEKNADQLKFIARPKDLNRRDRFIVYFDSIDESIAFAREASTYLEQQYIYASRVSFTIPIGNGPVSIGFDPVYPRGESWRRHIASKLANAINSVGTSDPLAIYQQISLNNIDPQTLSPADLVSYLRKRIGFL